MLLLTVAAITAAVWVAYAVVQAIKRNDRTRDERLHRHQKSFEQDHPPSASASSPLPPPRSPNAKPPRPPKPWWEPQPQPSRRRSKPMHWWFDREREEREERDRAAHRPELDGTEIMRILDIPPGPAVGRASEHLLEYRRDHGDQGKEAATAELLRWWTKQSR